MNVSEKNVANILRAVARNQHETGRKQRRLVVIGIQAVVFQKTEILTATALITSDPTYDDMFANYKNPTSANYISTLRNGKVCDVTIVIL
jgi:hypothetical protein